MVEIALRGVEMAIGRKYVLDRVDMTMRDGELTALVGSAESGKTSALKAIAGTAKIAAGEVFIGGRLVNKLRAGRRDVATVFESHGLLPHKNAYENIAFPLRMARLDKRTIDERVRAAAERFGLVEVLDVKPKKLSESQRHLVGLARAVVRQPVAYLFQDAPPGGNDDLRRSMREEMRRLRDEGATVVFATEDGDRARTIADRIIVMAWGRVQQSGSPRRIYERPANTIVAEYFGAPHMNLLPAAVTDCSEAGLRVRIFGDAEVTVPVEPDDALVGETLTLGIRPEHIALCRNSQQGIIAHISQKSLKGNNVVLELALGGSTITALVPSDADLGVAGPVSLHLPPEHCVLFDTDDRALKHVRR